MRLNNMILAACLVFCFAACGGGSSAPPVSRTFLMGSTPFFTSYDSVAGQVIFPDWRFENLGERDLLSLHVDDFLGVPWDYCDANACTNLPPAWVAQWQKLADDARATGKRIYLSLSPLGNRRTLAPNALTDGSTQAEWNTNVDANGCYLFDSDANAAAYQASYITYLKYIIDLVGPEFFSPAIEMNLPFSSCPAQKAAWIAWYDGVHTAIKQAYPQLVVFPTFQMEAMYGISDPAAACPSGTLSECFATRLDEALTIPADRIAFSNYPAAWVYHPEFNHSFPRDTFAAVVQKTTRKIWVSETGWPAMPVLSSYQHGATGSCGTALYPATLDIPGVGTVNVANDTAHAEYLAWLLGEAQSRGLEAVIWWLNRDYLDGAVVGNAACPCTPANDPTCMMLDQFYAVGGPNIEVLMRVFGNMALRYYDGMPRPGQAIWSSYIRRPYQP